MSLRSIGLVIKPSLRLGDEFEDSGVEGALIHDEALKSRLGHQVVEGGAARPLGGVRDFAVSANRFRFLFGEVAEEFRSEVFVRRSQVVAGHRQVIAGRQLFRELFEVVVNLP